MITAEEIETALSFFDELPCGDDKFEVEIKVTKLESMKPYVRTIIGNSGGWYSHFLKIKKFLEGYSSAYEQGRRAGLEEAIKEAKAVANEHQAIGKQLVEARDAVEYWQNQSEVSASMFVDSAIEKADLRKQLAEVKDEFQAALADGVALANEHQAMGKQLAETRSALEQAREEIKRLSRELFHTTKESPCRACGYNGPGFYQPGVHDCAGPTFCRGRL